MTDSTATSGPVSASSDRSHAAASLNRLPRATYRVQLRADFGFDEVRQLIPHLARLGISDLYLSPLFRARAESAHGYDVVDYQVLEPTFGGLEGFTSLAKAARDAGLGIVLDIVPNHMGINDPGNRFWNDILENGQSSSTNRYFDIDWHSPANPGQVLLPFLGKPFGETLESGELTVVYQDGRFDLEYFDRRFPISPATWPPILQAALKYAGDDDLDEDAQAEWESVVAQLKNMPSGRDDEESLILPRQREQRIARNRVREVVRQSPAIRRGLEKALADLNGEIGKPQSFDDLADLLSRQYYRLAYWRVAADEINYRRFFDINDLAAIRVEDEEVFERVHSLTFGLIAEGYVTGLRIDHPDGLFDPVAYFQHLQSKFRRTVAKDGSDQSLYVVVEKILTGLEELPQDWPVSGTTGYEFLNYVAGALVHSEGVARLRELYPELGGVTDTPHQVIYQGKQAILQDAMASELNVLADELFRIAKLDRGSQDFTRLMLLRTLREVIACFPVYRTYTRPVGWDVGTVDHGRVMESIRWARLRNPTIPRTVFDYLASVLLLQFPSHLSLDLQARWRHFTVKFQQVTGPITAKGIEDTSFYRYYPLASLNEVGGEPGTTGHSVDEFHRLMQHRVLDWPHAMSASTTHDTKRGEDVRARLHVLSECPDRWAEAVRTWHQMTQPFTTEISGAAYPDANERYLIYQTLLGTWPTAAVAAGTMDAAAWEIYLSRMVAYFQKAFREGKVHTSWTNPDEAFEQAVVSYLTALLSDGAGEFRTSMQRLAEYVTGPGFVNAITQVVLKAALPGVPDFYQGTAFWDFRLVDPDNRQPVDHRSRIEALERLEQQAALDPAAVLTELGASWSDEVKLYVTWRLLTARREHADVFHFGDYQPLTVTGAKADHVVAFARRAGEKTLVVVAIRLPGGLNREEQSSPLARPADLKDLDWEDTTVVLPEGAPAHWKNGLTDLEYLSTDGRLRVGDVVSQLGAAILIG